MLCLMASVCFTGVHVGWHPDKPSGDQTESKGLSGKTAFQFIYLSYISLLSVFPSGRLIIHQ